MRITSIILLIICFVSCTKDLSIDLDGHESKLVVNCFFSPQEPLSVHISKSTSILSTDTINYINNAAIELFQKGVLIGKSSQGKNGFYNIPAEINSELEYSIGVSVAGNKPVTSIDTVPVRVPILSFDTISIDSRYLYCEITFQDIANSDNYYLFDVTSKYPFLNSDSILTNQVVFIVSDFIVENGKSGYKRKYVYFSDQKIQGLEYDYSFLIDKQYFLKVPSS